MVEWQRVILARYSVKWYVEVINSLVFCNEQWAKRTESHLICLLLPKLIMTNFAEAACF